MRFNEDLKLTPIDVSWVTEEDILAETAMLPWVPVEQALERGQDLTRFFINAVLSTEMRRDPKTRINTERVFLYHASAAVQSWHLDFPAGYKPPAQGDLSFLSVGDRRKTQICDPVDVPLKLVKGNWPETLNAFIEERIERGELAVQDVATGTLIQSSQPFVHRGGPRYGTGWRWFADAYRPLP